MNKIQLKYLIHLVNEDLKADFKPEITAIPGRKFRFDYCDLNLKIAIEYEGIISEKSRHTNVKGYTNDCIKYNLAQLNDFIILRFTALNKASEILEIIKKAVFLKA